MLHLAAILADTTTTAAKSSSSSGGLNSILDPIAKPVAWLLSELYALVPNYGIAIMLLSVLWMIIISPLTLKMTRSMLAMSKLQPQLKRLQEQHRNDRQAFAQAQMELFREHNVSPFGACLPTLLPLPVFFALFRVIDGLSHTTNGVPNPLFVPHNSEMYHNIVASHGQLYAFGIDLSKNALSHHSSFWAALPYFGLVLIMMGTQYIQTIQAMSRNPAAQQSSQARIMKFLPLIFGLFCIRFPAGVVLYYAMSNVCRIIQQALMYRYDPKVKALVAEEVIEVEAKTRELDEHPDRTPAKAAPPAAPPARKRFRDLLAEEAAARQQGQGSTAGGGRGPSRSTPAKSATPPKGKATPPRTAAKKPSGSGSGSTQTPPLGVRRGLFANRSSGGPGSPPAKSGTSTANGASAAAGSSGTSGKTPPTPPTGKSQPASAGSGKSGKAGSDGTGTGGGGKGAGSGTGQGRTGAGAGAARGHRTNRKRRGR